MDHQTKSILLVSSFFTKGQRSFKTDTRSAYQPLLSRTAPAASIIPDTRSSQRGHAHQRAGISISVEAASRAAFGLGSTGTVDEPKSLEDMGVGYGQGRKRFL